MRLRFLVLLVGLAIAALWLAFDSPGGPPVQAAGDTVRVLDLPANDLIYDPATDTIYASVPPRDGLAIANTVTAIDPHTGEIGESVFIGSGPGRMALSDDGQYIYVALNGAAAVRRFEVATRTAGLQFSLGNDEFFGPFYPEDIAVMPGAPQTVAVSLRNLCCSPRHEGVAVYDDGVQRVTKTPGHTGANVIEFGDSASTLYGFNNETTEYGFRRMTVDAAGVTVTDVTPNLISGYGPSVDIEYDGGLIFTTNGQVVDPEAPGGPTLVGTFGTSGVVEPDSANGRAFFVFNGEVRAYDQSTFTLIGSLTAPDVPGGASLIRWGEDGLAFRTDDDRVVIMETSLVRGDPKPTPIPSPTPRRSPTPTPTVPPPRLYGDVNCDGRVNSLDVVSILQYLAWLVRDLPCFDNGDVTLNGLVNVFDAVIILQYEAGYLPFLPIPL